MSNIRIVAPIRKRMVMVFDVETTGLLPKKIAGQEILIESYPYIIQLSCIVYDLMNKQIAFSYDSYVKVPHHIEIPERVSELTGITKELCNEKGCDIIDALSNFYEAYMISEVVVAHNIDFDQKMIEIELMRNRKDVLDKVPYCFTIFSKIYEQLKGIERYCTMKHGIDICAIKIENRITKKWPKLSELHQKLFDEVPDGLHNSMVDVSACLRCYLKMRHGLFII